MIIVSQLVFFGIFKCFHETFRLYLVREFKYMFSVFKQHYMYFYTFSFTHIFKKIENCCLNTYTKRALKV